MTEPSADALADDALLAAFLDTLIPQEDPMPGAGSLGLGSVIRGQLAENAAFAAPVSAALSALRDAALERDPGGLPALDQAAREEVLKALLPKHPALGLLQMFAFMAYYQHPMALEGLGLPGRPPYPLGHEIDATEESLLVKLEARQRR